MIESVGTEKAAWTPSEQRSDLRLVPYLRSLQQRLEMATQALLQRELARMRTFERMMQQQPAALPPVQERPHG